MINRNQLIFIFFIKHQLNCWLVNFLSGDRWLWEWIGDRWLIYFLEGRSLFML
ncbi:hypothetical protein [Pseudanabaena mucicola]|uniref:hypothetical protein n=1 Tax=Pseudanabaena mucicola TaxID=71190 RepID=UPI002575C270|nr:hypothetical protein [Pseudanabaena mucicola]